VRNAVAGGEWLDSEAKMNDPDYRDSLLEGIAEHLRRIADSLDVIIDRERGVLKMIDVDRAKVYSTHLGGKLKDGS
jgi:hypothetical protein